MGAHQQQVPLEFNALLIWGGGSQPNHLVAPEGESPGCWGICGVGSNPENSLPSLLLSQTPVLIVNRREHHQTQPRARPWPPSATPTCKKKKQPGPPILLFFISFQVGGGAVFDNSLPPRL